MLQSLPEVQGDLVRWATSDIPRVPTGYSLFDRPTGGGPAPGEMVLFIARTGVGKTFWALNVLAANPETPAIFFSLEMHSRYLLKRLAAIHMNTPTKAIEKSLRETGHSAVVAQTVEDFPLLHMGDRPGLGIPDMLQATDDYEKQVGLRPKLLVVDFMELVRAWGAQTETEGIKRLAVGMKDLARESDAVVIVLHQVARGERVKRKGDEKAYADEGHRPLTKADAMHGGEASADFMFGGFRPGLDPALSQLEADAMKHDFRLQFLKSRGDDEFTTKPIQHYWDPPTGRIREIDWSRY